ncbi:MAG: hypothetical protein ACU0B1_10525 [Thermohalobaculum sp.]
MATWAATLDSSLIAVGDCLALDGRVFFVLSADMARPAVCVEANDRLDFFLAGAPAQGARGEFDFDSACRVAEGWPVALRRTAVGENGGYGSLGLMPISLPAPVVGMTVVSGSEAVHEVVSAVQANGCWRLALRCQGKL